MSWIKKRGQPGAPNQSAVPSVPMYNPNQHSSVQNQWQQQQQQNFQPPSNWYTQNANNPTAYTQPYNNSQSTQQQNQYWQQFNHPQQPEQTQQLPPQPPQNYNHYQYQNVSTQQQSYPYGNYSQVQNASQLQNVPQAPNLTQQQSQSEAESWNSWGWGREENNSNIPTGYSQNQASDTTSNITENFVNDETWNWSLEESSSSSSLQKQVSENPSYDAQVREDLFPKVGPSAVKHQQNVPPRVSDFENQNSQVVSGSSGVINKPTTLPAQWSTESQDSSENVQTSESNSRMLSRSSTTTSESSSHLLQDNVANVNNEKISVIESGGDRNRKISDTTLKNEPINRNVDVLQHENIEILSTVSRSEPTPPPPMKNQTPPLPPASNVQEDLKNPYKRTTGLSHRSINKFKSETQLPPPQNMTFAPPIPFQQTANLETLPDNSEQPDSYPLQSPQLVMRRESFQHNPENNEIAPINDRNQYLETGQLSNSELMTDYNDAMPPPGLQRMVLGQIKHNEDNVRRKDSGGNQVEEPPPGLSRMVLGQNVQSDGARNNEVGEPPAGLHRMVPGESSSPENVKWNKGTTKRSASRKDNASFPDPEIDSYFPDSAQNQPSQTRSETIGADTPPIPSNPIIDIENDDLLTVDLKTDDNKTRDSDSRRINKLQKNSADNTRRTSIDGQPEDAEIAVITSSVRDMTVGGNFPDMAASKTITERRTPRKHDTSDSDSKRDEIPSKSRDKYVDRDKDRRYRDRAEEKSKSKRYSPSPDRYREKYDKYDRRRYRDKRYEEDTDYYSDKEHKDRRREHKDKYEEYKKYSSLKKEKKDKPRRDPRDPREAGNREAKRGEYYYGRYDGEYEEAPRSRPSSRSDSMHESYRERTHARDKHRDRDRHRRPRDHRDAYMQMQGYPYDPYNPYYQQLQYQYYENLRRTNPQAYAEIYRKYYQQTGAQQAYGEEERASVHSGRSSANEELGKDRYTRQSFYSQASYPIAGDYYREGHSISGHYGHSDRMFDRTDSSLNVEETVTSQRLTPAKFTTAHIKASISSGLFVKILPHYPLDGQPAVVEIGGFDEYLQFDDEYRELSQFPGPLVKGVTHKKTVIEYCENKIRSALTNIDITDTDSYILMWELMILLLRQNGMVVGTDIAELLMKDRKAVGSRRPSITSNSSSLALERTESVNNLNSESSLSPNLKEEVITNKFREYLLYGSGKEALEWAMKHGLWGHALFLASKLDKRTYANVMTRFANGLPMNDPLQTLYQLLSGKLPAAVTCVADEKWGDWRPHLAMILSNTTQRPDLDRKAITTLADTLFSRGNLYAAHFCYLMAQVGFGRYDADAAKIVLLGGNHTRSFAHFATNEAIHLTEVYEYACSLNDPNFAIPEFQMYKYLLATRLSDRGLLEKSLGYLERVATIILQNPTEYQPSLVTSVCVLADKLKYCEPVVIEDPDAENIDFSTTRADNTWLKDLKSIEEHHKGEFVANKANVYQDESQMNNYVESQGVYQQPYQQQLQQTYPYGSNLESWQQQQQPQPTQTGLEQPSFIQDQQSIVDQNDGYNKSMYADQNQYWQNQQQQWSESVVDQQSANLNQFGQQQQQNELQDQSQSNLWSSAQHEPGKEVKNDRNKDVPRPQISLPNESHGRSAIFEGENKPKTSQPAGAQVKSKPAQEKPATTGWFGGIWNKLSLKPKNQMKLPDDKNPTIVWDETKKRWINLDEDGEGGSTELKPPPKMSDLMPNKSPAPVATPPMYNQSSVDYKNSSQQQPTSWNAANNLNYQNNNNHINSNLQAPMEDGVTSKPPVQPNMFKLQRGRNIKKSYVDVFNPGSTKSSSTPAASSDIFNSNTTSHNNNNNSTQMNFFIPAPVNDPNAPINFLTPAPIQPQQNEPAQ